MQNVFDMGDEFVAKALSTVLLFNRFNGKNDPLGRHEYGSLKIGGQPIFWRIEYFNMSGKFGLMGDPSKSRQTLRTLTIMLQREK